jgi:hypothetical protein
MGLLSVKKLVGNTDRNIIELKKYLDIS